MNYYFAKFYIVIYIFDIIVQCTMAIQYSAQCFSVKCSNDVRMEMRSLGLRLISAEWNRTLQLKYVNMIQESSSPILTPMYNV
jgi:hypothetical protein